MIVTKGSIYFWCLFDVEGPFGLFVSRQPRATTTEPWVVVGEDYIISIIVVFAIGSSLGLVLDRIWLSRDGYGSFWFRIGFVLTWVDF